MSGTNQKICFVVMGFGRKTDYETGRTLDLDATYEAIIQPAIHASNMRCIRADEIIQSGLIDAPMYEMLLMADLVVADISTGNPNAVYELGVRHALRPNATIIMKESEGRLYFDLNHMRTFKYDHLGDDIGVREANRAKKELEIMIKEVMALNSPDSPVYTFLPKLIKPTLSKEEYVDLVDETEEFQNSLSSLIKTGLDSIGSSDFDQAIKSFTIANQMRPKDAFIIQQLALATYKCKKPDEHSSLLLALSLIEQLSPETSNDPETLGITGAIYKRIWHNNNNIISNLDLAIKYYGRGFEIRRDYYNGENLALCHDLRSQFCEHYDDFIYYRISAKKIREEIVSILSQLISSPSFEERSDIKWIYASLANCYLGLNNEVGLIKFEKLFFSQTSVNWEIKTYNANRSILEKLQENTRRWRIHEILNDKLFNNDSLKIKK
jgi:tetratricopeptide (TPR) repeat protein